MSQQTFIDQETGKCYRFTWRTIETWVVRHKKHGMAVLDKKTRSDKNTQRKVSSAQLAEAINEVLPTLSLNKAGMYIPLPIRHYLPELFERAKLALFRYQTTLTLNVDVKVEQLAQWIQMAKPEIIEELMRGMRHLVDLVIHEHRIPPKCANAQAQCRTVCPINPALISLFVDVCFCPTISMRSLLCTDTDLQPV